MCSLVCTWQIIVRDKRGDPLLTKELDARYTGCRERKRERERGWGEISQWYNSVLFRCTMCMQNLLSLVPSSLLSVTCSMVKQERFFTRGILHTSKWKKPGIFPDAPNTVQPTTRSMLCVYDSCPSLARYVPGIFCSSCCSELPSCTIIPFLSMLMSLAVRKDTRLSPTYPTASNGEQEGGAGNKATKCENFLPPCIAGNFWGSKLLRILRFCNYLQKFSPWNWWGRGCGIFWCWQRRAIRESFLYQNLIAAHSWIFFPLKVSHCTVIVICHSSGQWKSTDWPFIKFTCFRTVLPSSWCCPGGSGGESCTCHAPLSRSPCGGGPSVSAWMCPVIGQAH